jgi:hypothetical protein
VKTFALLFALFAAPAFAFTLITFAGSPATPLVWYEAQSPATGAAPEGVDFTPRFVPYGLFGLDGGGSFFGTDSYQFDSITCGWAAAGTVSGGTDVMRVQLIQKSDAGVVCTCDLPGACNDAAGSEHTCGCGATKYLGAAPEPGKLMGQGYAIQLHTATNCAGNPQVMRCAIPFRK